jgi:hypothetical protein
MSKRLFLKRLSCVGFSVFVHIGLLIIECFSILESLKTIPQSEKITGLRRKPVQRPAQPLGSSGFACMTDSDSRCSHA